MLIHSIALLEKELSLLQMVDPQRTDVIKDYKSGIQTLKDLESALEFMRN